MCAVQPLETQVCFVRESFGHCLSIKCLFASYFYWPINQLIISYCKIRFETQSDTGRTLFQQSSCRVCMCVCVCVRLCWLCDPFPRRWSTSAFLLCFLRCVRRRTALFLLLLCPSSCDPPITFRLNWTLNQRVLHKWILLLLLLLWKSSI